MNRGVKLKNPNTKKLAGTYKPSVDDGTAPIAHLPNDTPSPPDWLSEGARKVWASDIDRVVACGAREVDSNFYALYCETLAAFIATVEAGEVANAAFRSELRKQAEMLGIAGAKARLAKIGSTTDKPKASPFSLRPE